MLIEAAALGVPIAAMDTGGTRDILQRRRHGAALGRRRRLLARPRAARRRRARSARRSAPPRAPTSHSRFAAPSSSSASSRSTGRCSSREPPDGPPRPLRVAVVARAVMPLHGVGGLERSVHDLVRHLAARGVDVTLIVAARGPRVASIARAIRSPRRASRCGTCRT